LESYRHNELDMCHAMILGGMTEAMGLSLLIGVCVLEFRWLQNIKCWIFQRPAIVDPCVMILPTT